MIGYLSGTIKHITSDMIILDVSGVGYEVLMPSRWIQNNASALGKKVVIYAHTVVRENDISIIGFSSMAEKQMFARLLKVSSVGPKTALLVISSYSVEEIEKAVEDQDIEIFLQIKGLAKKTSQK